MAGDGVGSKVVRADVATLLGRTEEVRVEALGSVLLLLRVGGCLAAVACAVTILGLYQGLSGGRVDVCARGMAPGQVTAGSRRVRSLRSIWVGRAVPIRHGRKVMGRGGHRAGSSQEALEAVARAIGVGRQRAASLEVAGGVDVVAKVLVLGGVVRIVRLDLGQTQQ